MCDKKSSYQQEKTYRIARVLTGLWEKAVTLVSQCLAFLVINPVADGFLMTFHPLQREQ